MKSSMKLPIMVILIVLLYLFASHIRYIFSGGDDIVLAPPERFFFIFASKTSDGDLYLTSEESYFEGYNEDGYDSISNTYHLYVDNNYLDNNDTIILISGDYWNCPNEPKIKVDGKMVEKVSSNNSGYADWALGDTYFSKIYHFSYEDNVLSEHPYEIYVQCGQKSVCCNIIFHENKL